MIISGHGMLEVTKPKQAPWPSFLYVCKNIKVRFTGPEVWRGKDAFDQLQEQDSRKDTGTER